LFVYLAREAPVAAVLRRGPSDWVQLTRWQIDTDTFEPGQWMKGRVYERRSDLSADGGLFLGFVRQSGGQGDLGVDTWLAISRLPWFTALALWSVGGTYHTGGYFPDRHTVWTGYGSAEPDRGRLPSWLRATSSHPPRVDRTTNWTERTVWMNRLLRDDWQPLDDGEPERWQKRSPAGRSRLVMTLRSDSDFRAYGGPHVLEYALHPDGADAPVLLDRVTWADWDHRGRLIVARDGRIEHWQDGEFHLLADFNLQKPDPQPAPTWATEWPSSPSH
jgi:hypothetical protein